jgi:hypothetical protein
MEPNLYRFSDDPVHACEPFGQDTGVLLNDEMTHINVALRYS